MTMRGINQNKKWDWATKIKDNLCNRSTDILVVTIGTQERIKAQGLIKECQWASRERTGIPTFFQVNDEKGICYQNIDLKGVHFFPSFIYCSVWAAILTVVSLSPYVWLVVHICLTGDCVPDLYCCTHNNTWLNKMHSFSLL